MDTKFDIKSMALRPRLQAPLTPPLPASNSSLQADVCYKEATRIVM